MNKYFKIASTTFAILGFIFILGILLGALTNPNYWVALGISRGYIQDMLTPSPVEDSAKWAFIFFCLSFVTIIAEKVWIWWDKHLE